MVIYSQNWIIIIYIKHTKLEAGAVEYSDYISAEGYLCKTELFEIKLFYHLTVCKQMTDV